jgi:hypothetical protein
LAAAAGAGAGAGDVLKKKVTTPPIYSLTGPFNPQGGIGTTPYGPTIITNISGTNLTNPSATASSVVSAIKYGTAVTVNTTTLAGIAAASATKSTTQSSAQIIANRRAQYGEI